MVNPNIVTVQPQASVESVLGVFERGKVIAIAEGDHPVGILTKIDLIDYLTRQME